MKNLTIKLLALPIFALLSCKEPAQQEVAKNAIPQKTAATLPVPTQITFGRFCGECMSHCATMYRYIAEDQKTMVADNTDSYFGNRKPTVFDTSLKGAAYLKLGDEIIGQIPRVLLDSKKDTETFGCPDCDDGCGLYLEVEVNGTTKQFYIDYQTDALNGEIKAFSDYLKTRIADIESLPTKQP
jgi:hypothetical protein